LKKTCPTDFRCMTAVTVEDVVEAALTLINGTTGPRPDHRKS